MAQIELGITILIEQADAERLRKAFGRRLGNPDVTLDIVLGALKKSAISQIGEVIIAEEHAALDAQKSTITPPPMS